MLAITRVWLVGIWKSCLRCLGWLSGFEVDAHYYTLMFEGALELAEASIERYQGQQLQISVADIFYPDAGELAAC